MPTDLRNTDFKQILIDSGIPVTDEEFQSQWDAQLIQNDFVVNNNSPLSPFWRLQKGGFRNVCFLRQSGHWEILNPT